MIYLPWQVSPFVILMQGGRVGSSYLTTALDTHPAVRAYPEILVGLSHEQQERVCHRVLRRRPVGRAKAIGFKTKLTDIVDPERFALYLHRNEVRTIVLTRENLVKIVVSWINSERLHEVTGDYNLFGETRRDLLPPLVIDQEDFRNRLIRVERQKQRFSDYAERLQVPKMTVSYEQMFAPGSDCLARIQAFLKVPVQPLEGRTRKVTSDNLHEAIVCFDDLQSSYLGTRYEWMFRETNVVQEAPVSLGSLS